MDRNMPLSHDHWPVFCQPGTILLLGFGLLGAIGYGRRRLAPDTQHFFPGMSTTGLPLLSLDRVSRAVSLANPQTLRPASRE
jgi:hypothetical protein